MERKAPNISTEYQPKGSGLNPSDTLDRPEAPEPVPGTDGRVRPKGAPNVVDEKGRPLRGDGLIDKN